MLREVTVTAILHSPDEGLKQIPQALQGKRVLLSVGAVRTPEGIPLRLLQGVEGSAS